jgi:hypothetical protein
MKTTAVGYFLSTLMSIAAGATAQVGIPSALPGTLPILKAGAQIRVANKALSIGHTASPEVLDWNNDGKRDLLVGTFEAGKVMLFLNRGTDAAPKFDEGRVLEAGGKPISVGFG